MISEISVPKKIKKNLVQTIRVQTDSFVKMYKGKSQEVYQCEEDLVDSLLFYWFINSIEKKYKWLEQKNLHSFLNSYSTNIRNELKNTYYELEIRSGKRWKQ